MRRHCGQERRATRAAMVGALLVLAGLAGAAQASAATYHTFLCRIPYGPNAGKPAPTDGTSYTSNSPPRTLARQTCATGGAMSATVLGTESHAVGDGAAVLFDVPSGLALSGFRLWRHEAVGQASGGAGPFTKAEYGSTPLEPDCNSGAGCHGRGDPSSPLSAGNAVTVANAGGATRLRWNAFCGGTGTCAANTGGAVYDVYAADMLLDDPAAPGVSNLRGSLLSSGQPLAGAHFVTFDATDAGSGVHEGTLLVDGAVAVKTVLDPNGGSCANLGVAPDARPSFANLRPCPASVNGVLTVNTDALAPGPHTFTVVVGDAAGNQTVAGTTTATVVGTVPPGTPNGVPASRDAKLSARFGTHGPRTRRLGYRSRPTISGRLLTAAGGPIATATVDILVRDKRTGARTVRIASARTDASGRFRLQLPSGPARTITLRYTAFSGEKPSATARLRALVRAQLTIAATPRSVRAGAPLRLTGRLRYLRRAAVLVTIQVKESTGWRTFDTVKTRRDGGYRWTHRFRTRGRTVAFRARVDSPIYPFQPGTSPVVRVRFR